MKVIKQQVYDWIAFTFIFADESEMTNRNKAGKESGLT